MKKIGPLSLDLVVACQIYELQENGTRAEYAKLTEKLKGLVGESTIPSLLRSLADWGIITTEFGKTEQGRAGRFYFISGEASEMMKETYDLFWDKVLKERRV